MTPERPVHIAYACDERYLPWCAAAIRSCLDFTAEGVTIHLLHDGSLDGNADVERVAVMVQESGGVFVVHPVRGDAVDVLPIIDRFGKAVWLRFLLPVLLADVERVLYLDVDTLVVSPLEPLFAIDMGDAPLAAVSNVYSPEQRARVHALGIEDHRRYFNSGVLLLDLDRLRSENAVESLMRVVSERADDLEMPDQDALNLVFGARWHSLHPRWNAQNKLWEDRTAAADYLGAAANEARSAPAIVHFEGPSLCKPWHALSVHPWRRQWWATLRRTPFAGTAAEHRGPVTTGLRYLPRPLRIKAYFWLAKRRDRART